MKEYENQEVGEIMSWKGVSQFDFNILIQIFWRIFNQFKLFK